MNFAKRNDTDLFFIKKRMKFAFNSVLRLTMIIIATVKLIACEGGKTENDLTADLIVKLTLHLPVEMSLL